jgi:integrase
VERDKRGRKFRRQRTRNFPRRGTYEQLAPDGSVVKASALDAAVAFKEKMDTAARLGQSVSSNEELTLDEFFGTFLAGKQRRPTTVENYQTLDAKHIRPTLGAWLLRDLSVEVLEVWEGHLVAGPAAKRASIQLLKAVLNRANARGIIATNPGRALDVKQAVVRSIPPDEVLTPNQVDALAAGVGDRYSALIYLLAYGGLRIGEAAALRAEGRLDIY